LIGIDGRHHLGINGRLASDSAIGVPTVGKAAKNLFMSAAENGCDEELETAALFFRWLILEVGRGSEVKEIHGDARTLMMQWLPLTDPLRIAEDPECGYGRAAGFES
jgi:hypothetical protein